MTRIRPILTTWLLGLIVSIAGASSSLAQGGGESERSQGQPQPRRYVGDHLSDQTPHGGLNRLVRRLRSQRMPILTRREQQEWEARHQQKWETRNRKQQRPDAPIGPFVSRPHVSRSTPLIRGPMGVLVTPGQIVSAPGAQPGLATRTIVATFATDEGARAAVIYNPSQPGFQVRILTNRLDVPLNPIGQPGIVPLFATRQGTGSFSGVMLLNNLDLLGPMGRTPTATETAIPTQIQTQLDTLGPLGRRP